MTYYDQIFIYPQETVVPVTGAEFENCVFENGDFSEADWSRCIFDQCTFKSCNLSGISIFDATIREVTFQDCKIWGVPFFKTNALGLSMQFLNCSLNHGVFYQLKIKNTRFENCILDEVDFSETDLSKSVFLKCDLRNAIFDHSNLEGCDFASSYGFTLDPEQNRIKGARFAASELAGLLHKYQIIIEDGSHSA